MVFVSVEFLALFLPVFFLFYALTPKRWRNLTLLIASWVFYAWWKPVFLTLLVAVTFLAWAYGLFIAHSMERGDLEKANSQLKWSIILNIGCLAWFKYANLLVATLNGGLELANTQPVIWDDIILPIGLSFFVMHSMSYLIDVRRGVVQAQPSFVAFGAYIAMFGQLIAGPIVRYSWVDKAITERSLTIDGMVLGGRRFMIGFAMKVLIADTLSPLVDVAFKLPNPSLADAWLGCLAYTLQLYFDFAGYSAMAIGIGLMLGFNIHENFNNPYLSVSIQDFWRRWHISLSTWLRDYLYIPLGGNRKGVSRTYLNLIATMAIGGLWHGASWTFMVWGMIHGLSLAVDRWWTRSDRHMPTFISYPLTMLVVMLAWTLFRANDWTTAIAMLSGQIGLHGVPLGDQLAVALRPTETFFLIAGLVCVWYPAFAERLPQRFQVPPGWWNVLWPVLLFIYSFIVLKGRETVPFLYFQF